MITVRKAEQRGRTQIEWLDSWHSFSFGDYHDPGNTHFRSLRVINDDTFGPGHGFGMHPHRDMEIITYIMSGELEHRDSMGNGAVLRRGDVQRMSAGSGLYHSESNPSPDEPCHLLQIWITPQSKGIEPSYEDRHFGDELNDQLRVIASPDGHNESTVIHQDARIYAGRIRPGFRELTAVLPGRHIYVFVASGRITVNEIELDAGDAAVLSEEPRLDLQVLEPAEVLVFDLA